MHNYDVAIILALHETKTVMLETKLHLFNEQLLYGLVIG